MSDPFALDKRLARRSFERAAATYDASAVLQNEVCRRMLARLDYIKVDPRLIVDAGSGTGNALPGLLERYPGARVVALDLALEMARHARARRPWWKDLLVRGARLAAVCGDIERLPFSTGCAGVVWSNLALQWMTDPKRAFAEMYRVLEPGGLLLFSSFGPDTLRELRAAFQAVDRDVHVHRFLDMHDVGDLLVAGGFADPVMDMEVVTLTYSGVRELMRDLKAIGARNAALGRRGGLSGKTLLDRLVGGYEPFRREGKLPATFEVVYGHAWKPLPRMSHTGHPVIDIKPQGGR